MTRPKIGGTGPAAVDGAAELGGDGVGVGESEATEVGLELAAAELVGDATGLGLGFAQPATIRVAATSAQPRPGPDPIRLVPTACTLPHLCPRSSSWTDA